MINKNQGLKESFCEKLTITVRELKIILRVLQHILVGHQTDQLDEYTGSGT